MDKVIGVVETRNRLPAVLKEVARGKRYIITQRSHARAVLISPEELETLEISADKKLLEDLKTAKEEIARGRYVRASDYFKKKKHSKWKSF